MTTIHEIVQTIDRAYPFAAQEPWDNAGLLCGDETRGVTVCLLALDVTRAVVGEAKRLGAELILSHHPIIFSPARSVLAPSALYDALSAGIAVLSAHTNFDVAADGVNDILCEHIGLTDCRCPEDTALRIGHPPRPTTVRALSEDIAARLDVTVSFTLGEKTVRTVAVCPGAGGDRWQTALDEGADCLFTGEAKYHECLDAAERGLAILMAGHFETEYPAVVCLQRRLSRLFPDVRFVAFDREPPISTIVR